MRVAIVHSFYSTKQPSGENNVVLDQAAELRHAGHDVELIGRHTDDHIAERGYGTRSAATVVTGIGPSPEARLNVFSPDVIHLHNTFPNWGTQWLGKWGPRTICTLHNFRPVCANGLLFRDGHHCEDCLLTPALPAVRHRCYRSSSIRSIPAGLGSSPIGGLRKVPLRSARVIALNEGSAALYRGILGREVDVVPNFVGRPSQLRSSEASAVWLYVGRLSEEKGADVLLRHWPRGERLDVYGDGPLATQLQQANRSNDDIRFKGLVPRSELVPRFGGYAGLVIPSMCTEQLPTVVLEALASALPSIVSHHVTAGPELERNGVAVRFDPAERGSLWQAMRQVRAEREDMSRAALEHYEARYSPEVWRRQVETIYDAVRRSALA